MLFVNDSFIAGVSWGLFLRTDWHGTFNNRKNTMCLYSRVILSNEQIPQLPSQDHLIKVHNGYVDASMLWVSLSI